MIASVLTVIILSCQVTGVLTGSFVSGQSYRSAFEDQNTCQASLIKCVEEKKLRTEEDALTSCLKERAK